MNIRVNDGFSVLLRTIPVPTGIAPLLSAPVLLEIVPPEHPEVSALVQVPPFPVIVNPAVAPVVSRMIPFDPLTVEDMLLKVKPLAPIVVLATLSAVPVVVVSVLTIEVLF